jgi:hypothetical protein
MLNACAAPWTAARAARAWIVSAPKNANPARIAAWIVAQA